MGKDLHSAEWHIPADDRQLLQKEVNCLILFSVPDSSVATLAADATSVLTILNALALEKHGGGFGICSERRKSIRRVFQN